MPRIIKPSANGNKYASTKLADVAFDIPMKPVISSNLAAVGYDAASETLRVKFKSGLVYTYSGVPYTVFYALSKASSLGSYFYYNIRTSYPYTKSGAAFKNKKTLVKVTKKFPKSGKKTLAH